jgi:hypothetical protein
MGRAARPISASPPPPRTAQLLCTPSPYAIRPATAPTLERAPARFPLVRDRARGALLLRLARWLITTAGHHPCLEKLYTMQTSAISAPQRALVKQIRHFFLAPLGVRECTARPGRARRTSRRLGPPLHPFPRQPPPPGPPPARPRLDVNELPFLDAPPQSRSPGKRSSRTAGRAGCLPVSCKAGGASHARRSPRRTSRGGKRSDPEFLANSLAC